MQYIVLRIDRLSITAVIGFLLLMIQCKEASPDQIKVNQRHASVMGIHDEVMPKMKDIYNLKKKLRQLNNDVSTDQLIKDLEEADESMMSWMHQYKKPSKTDESAFTYLDKQEEEIKNVRDQMLTAITNAQKYLDNE